MESRKPRKDEPMRRCCAADNDEPAKEEIMEDIRVGLQQAAAGEGRPAREAFRELRRKIAGKTCSRKNAAEV